MSKAKTTLRQVRHWRSHRRPHYRKIADRKILMYNMEQNDDDDNNEEHAPPNGAAGQNRGRVYVQRASIQNFV